MLSLVTQSVILFTWGLVGNAESQALQCMSAESESTFWENPLVIPIYIQVWETLF
jgi:hypothetical protein